MRTVDFHAHPVTDVFRRNIDRLGIDFTVLSPPCSHIHNGDDNRSIQAAREINEDLSRICRENEVQLGFVSCLPLPCVDGSIQEIQYGMQKLGALGVKVPTNCNGVYLVDSKLDAVMYYGTFSAFSGTCHMEQKETLGKQ